MKYETYTQKELIARIEELEILNRELLKEKEAEVGLDYPWTGNLGHWYWNIKTNTVTFNLLKATALGYTESEIPSPVTYQFFTDKLHPEDYQKTMDAMLAHLYGNAPVYEVEYRIQAKDGTYKWYYDRGKITQTDELGKPVFLAGIVFDITRSKEQQIELEEKNRILQNLASQDGLTRISNHKTLIEYLELQLNQVKTEAGSLTIAMLDIDDFKKVNDNYGHIVGDTILYETATLIKNHIRDGDLVGRYGGEEFLVIFSHTELAKAIEVAERIRKMVEETTFSEGVKITISGGVKQYEGESLIQFIDGADKRLYQAKKNGKNRIEDRIR